MLWMTEYLLFLKQFLKIKKKLAFAMEDKNYVY
jgi:hypothetical protein